ncbi:MAG: dihydropteroate synthase [Paludibacteraceae bacterium]|nr:dihydropteroate synthase [Paludibacteraceae bacterium]
MEHTENKKTWSLRDGERLLSYQQPQVMAIVNLTPDSFFAASRHHIPPLEGVGMVDVGAMSTRPGHEDVSADEELRRLLEGWDEVAAAAGDAVLSVDTFRPEVVRGLAEKHRFAIINDISGGSEEMYDTAASLQKAYVLTYPEGGATDEMMMYFSKRIDALARRGVCDILLDPGFGFGKTLERNYELAANLKAVQEIGLPILIGVSRKSMLTRALGLTPETALNATTALHAFLLERGADILRVHDTREAVEAIKIHELLNTYAHV